MFQAVAIATASGTVSYLWMTASALPLTRAFRATCRNGRHGWRYALPLAVGGSVMAALAVSALVVLIVMSQPQLGASFGDRAILATGSLTGLALWCVRSAALGVPRLGHDIEMALALAVVALRTDDAELLSRVEHEYARHVVDVSPDSYVPHAVRTVLGV
jgi:hypothetical protein